MKRIVSFGSVLTLVAVVSTRGLSAHRVDECLQAARIDIAPDAVGIELDLTPGMKVARQVFSWIDRDGDNAVSASERVEFVNAVRDATVLEIDGRRLALTVTSAQIPGFEAMAQGVGTIRLKARAADEAMSWPGTHALMFRNAYRPEIGVYLVNALVPSSTGISIAGQHRDPLQRETRIDYRVAPAFARSLGLVLVPGLLVAALLCWSVRLKPDTTRAGCG